MIAFCPHQFAGHFIRHILLADMHAVGAAGQRNINPVVNDQRNIDKDSKSFLTAMASSTKRRVRKIFFTQLDISGAALHRLQDNYPAKACCGTNRDQLPDTHPRMTNPQFSNVSEYHFLSE